MGGASVAGGALVGSAGTAAAGTTCGDCSSDTIYGEKVTITEFGGHTAWYQIVTMNGIWENACFDDSMESHDCEGNSISTWVGTVRNGSDSMLLSGGAIKYIRVCDIDDPGALVSVSKGGHCGSPCHVDYSGYSDVGVYIDEGNGGDCGCSDYDGSSSIGRPYYAINLTGSISSASNLESDDRIMSKSDGEAEGYVDYDSDVDYYYGEGIFDTVNVEPKGHDVWVERGADEAC